MYYGHLGITYDLIHSLNGFEFFNSTEWRDSTLGNFVELIPYACLGILIRELKIFEKLNKHKKVVYIIIFSLLFFMLITQNYSAICGFHHAGLYKFLPTFFLIFIFYNFNFTNISQKIVTKINSFSKYCIGILFVSRFCNLILQNIILKEITGNIHEYVLVVLSPILLTIIISKLPIKNIKKIIT